MLEKFCLLLFVLICVCLTAFISPLRNISPCASVLLLGWQDGYKTRRKSAGLCHHCRLHSPSKKERTEMSRSAPRRSQCSWHQEVPQRNGEEAVGLGSPPHPAERPAAWPWRWCLPVRGSVSPSQWGAAERSAALAGSVLAASCRAPQRCRDSVATAGCAGEGSHRFGCGK